MVRGVININVKAYAAVKQLVIFGQQRFVLILSFRTKLFFAWQWALRHLHVAKRNIHKAQMKTMLSPIQVATVEPGLQARGWAQ